MNATRKSWLCRIIGIVLVASLLASCGGGGNAEAEDCEDEPTEMAEDWCEGDFVEDHLKKKTTTTKKPKKVEAPAAPSRSKPSTAQPKKR
jgi:hypothetical protein